MVLNRQRLLERRLEATGKISYVFERSAETDDLIERWDSKSAEEIVLARFSAIVSYEIQWAVRIRRAAGLRPRFKAPEMS